MSVNIRQTVCVENVVGAGGEFGTYLLELKPQANVYGRNAAKIAPRTGRTMTAWGFNPRSESRNPEVAPV